MVFKAILSMSCLNGKLQGADAPVAGLKLPRMLDWLIDAIGRSVPDNDLQHLERAPLLASISKLG